VRLAAAAVLLAAACGDDDSAPAAPTPTSTPAATPTPFGPIGGDRPAQVFVPAAYDPATPAPLLVLLHSYTLSGTTAESVFQLRPVAEEHGFLYAIPEGLVDRFMNGPFWNATSGCCDFDRSMPDDSAYIRRVIEDVMLRWNVDRSRIFTIGLSNGGFMGHRLACDHADLIAGIVSIAGATHNDPSLCDPEEGVHILNIHGTEDTIIHYGGGVFVGPYPSAEETVQRWVDLNQCASAASGGMIDADRSRPGDETVVTRWTDCRPGGSVEFWQMIDAGHYFIPTDEFDQTVFEYFLSHPKP
jgi:polyhydroxybutyrate depolymerase